MKYVLLGLGYISIRHIQAIFETGGELIAVYDPYNSAGKLDKYFPDCKFFNEFEMFDDYLSGFFNLVICSPNYLHYNHIQYGLRKAGKVICEKPIVINKNQFEKIKNKPVYPIMQLRLHPAIKNLKLNDDMHDVEINYTTYRGDWYSKSWKGNDEKSGSLIYNIGIHICDILTFLFGQHKTVIVNYKTDTDIQFNFKMERAFGKCNLSISDKNVSRIIKIDGQELDLTKNFDNLHTEIYKLILQDNWYDVRSLENTINFVEAIKNYEKKI